MLGGLGVVSLLFYVATNFLIPQSPEYMARSRATLIDQFPIWKVALELPLPVPTTAWAVISVLMATAMVTLGCYILALRITRLTRVSPITLSIVIGFAILFFLTSTLSMPNFSGDLYSYILYARVSSIYHANPYAVPPATFGSDPFLQFADPSWSQVITSYGPVWTYLSSIWQRLAGEEVVRNLLAFRVLLLGFNLANVALIWKILGRLNPTYLVTGILFYAWNPIVVLKGQGHLDTVMVFFILLSVYLYVIDREWLGLIAITLSVLTKFITAPLLVVYLLFLWRRGSFRSMLIGAGLAGALVVLAFLPFWDGWEMVERLARAPGSTTASSFLTPRRIVFAPGFLAAILWVGVRGRATFDNMLRGWAIVLLWFSLFLMPTFFSWYLLTLIAIVSLTNREKIVALTLALFLSALLTNMLGLTARDYVSPSIWLFRAIWWVPPITVMAWLYRAEWARMLVLPRQFGRYTRP